MKTSEMIAALEKNPRLKFSRKCNEEIYHLGERGYLTRFDSSSVSANIRIDDDWELVKEPVTWQEAMAAWTEGKTIYYEITGGKNIFPGSKFYLETDYGRPISKDEISKCKWYIEDGVADD